MSPHNPEKTGLEKKIDDVLREMDGVSADTVEFEKMTDQLVKLHAMKTQESRPRVSPDVKATIAANLAGIVMVVAHERVHIITTKALGFVKKLW
jgi:Golgi nucleoside diphosphatase